MTEEGRRLLAAATEMPWFSTDMTGVPDAYGFLRGAREAIFGSEPDGTRPGVAPVVFGHANTALIVAAVNQYAALLDDSDELQDIREQLAELTEDRTASDPDDEWHRGFHEAVRRLRAALPPSRDSTPDPLE